MIEIAHATTALWSAGVAEHNVTVARAFTKLMGAFVTFWDNDAGSKIHLLVTGLEAGRSWKIRLGDFLLSGEALAGLEARRSVSDLGI